MIKNNQSIIAGLVILIILCTIIYGYQEGFNKNIVQLSKDITNTNKVEPYQWNKFKSWLTYQTYTGGLCNKSNLTNWMSYRLKKYFNDKVQLVETKIYQPEMYVVRFLITQKNRFEFGDNTFVLKTFWQRIGFKNSKEVWRLNNVVLDTNNIYPIWKNANVKVTDLYETKMNNLYDKQGYLRFEPTLPRPSINEYLKYTTKYNPTIPTVHFSKMCNTPDDYANNNCLLTNEYLNKI
jgi:hypothetical protein